MLLGVLIAGLLIIAAVGIGIVRSKKVHYTYEPVTDVAPVRACITNLTGSSEFDIEKMLQDQALFADIYRFCLKTVDDVEATLLELAK